MSNEHAEGLAALLPKSAELGLEQWLNAIHKYVPPSPDFACQLLWETAQHSSASTVGYVLGKVMDLIVYDVIDYNVCANFRLPYETTDAKAIHEVLYAIRLHASNILPSAGLAPRRPSTMQGHNLQTIWSTLEGLAVDKVAGGHVTAALLLLWVHPQYTPVLGADDYGGIYREALAAAILQAQSVESVYRSILDCHRPDSEGRGFSFVADQVFDPSDIELSRRYCFSVVIPEQLGGYDLWIDSAENVSYSELCALLRMKLSQVHKELPDDVTN